MQTAQVLRRALADEAGDILCFLPGAAEIGRVQRTLEESSLDSSVGVQPLIRRARRGGSGCGDQSESFGPAQDRARDQHRGDQSHDRGRARGRRLGAASLCAVRSCQGDESPGDGEAVAGRCGSAARTRRPAEHGYLLPLVVRGRAGDARRADTTRDPACGPGAARPRARLLGRCRPRALALARSAAARPARAGARSAAAARGNRCGGARHAARPLARRHGRSPATRAYADQRPRYAGAAPRQRDRRDSRRARHPARGARAHATPTCACA